MKVEYRVTRMVEYTVIMDHEEPDAAAADRHAAEFEHHYLFNGMMSRHDVARIAYVGGTPSSANVIRVIP